MGVGHAGLAVGASRFAPRVNVGWLVFAAFFCDFLLGIFAYLGMEHATAPPDFAARHYFWFTFPYSHGLVAVVVWSLAAGFLVSRLRGSDRKIVFWVIAALVFSHFVLDALVHVVGLPLLGDQSPKIGFGLWNQLPLELSLETLMAVVGVVIFLRVAGPDCPAVTKFGVPSVIALLTFVQWTQLSMVAPPAPEQLMLSWIAAPLVLGGAIYGLDWKRLRRTTPV
jgi:hypothetical protein